MSQVRLVVLLEPDALTEAMVRYLAAVQEKDGSWRCDDFRPPLEGTAWSTLALLNTLDRAQTESAAVRH